MEEEPLYGLTYLPRKFKAGLVEVLGGKSCEVQVSLSLKIRGKAPQKKYDALNMGSCTRNDIDFFLGGGGPRILN